MKSLSDYRQNICIRAALTLLANKDLGRGTAKASDWRWNNLWWLPCEFTKLLKVSWEWPMKNVSIFLHYALCEVLRCGQAAGVAISGPLGDTEWGLPSLLPATIDILVFSIQRAQHSSGHRSQFVLEDDSDIRVRSAEGRSGNLRKITFNFFIKTTFTVHNWTVSASADWGGKDIKLLRLLFSCLQLPPLP